MALFLGALGLRGLLILLGARFGASLASSGSVGAGLGGHGRLGGHDGVGAFLRWLVLVLCGPLRIVCEARQAVHGRVGGGGHFGKLVVEVVLTAFTIPVQQLLVQIKVVLMCLCILLAALGLCRALVAQSQA